MNRFGLFALKAAREAGSVLSNNFGRLKSVRAKSKSNFVSNADLESEKKILSLLEKNFPEHAIVCEETRSRLSDKEFVWVIDPLDGTNNFVNGIPFACVSIALLERGSPLVGVVFDSFRDELFFAEKGKGAFLNGKKIFVSEKRSFFDSVVGTDLGYFGEGRKECVKRLSSISNKVGCTRVFGAAALGLAYVACGRFSSYYHGFLQPWDFCAAALIVEEAGGKVTDFKGSQWSFRGHDIAASNKFLHKKLLSLVKGK